MVLQPILDPTEPLGSNKEQEAVVDAEKVRADKGKNVLSPFEVELKKTEGPSTSHVDPPSEP